MELSTSNDAFEWSNLSDEATSESFFAELEDCESDENKENEDDLLNEAINQNDKIEKSSGSFDFRFTFPAAVIKNLKQSKSEQNKVGRVTAKKKRKINTNVQNNVLKRKKKKLNNLPVTTEKTNINDRIKTKQKNVLKQVYTASQTKPHENQLRSEVLTDEPVASCSQTSINEQKMSTNKIKGVHGCSSKEKPNSLRKWNIRPNSLTDLLLRYFKPNGQQGGSVAMLCKLCGAPILVVFGNNSNMKSHIKNVICLYF